MLLEQNLITDDMQKHSLTFWWLVECWVSVWVLWEVCCIFPFSNYSKFADCLALCSFIFETHDRTITFGEDFSVWYISPKHLSSVIFPTCVCILWINEEIRISCSVLPNTLYRQASISKVPHPWIQPNCGSKIFQGGEEQKVPKSNTCIFCIQQLFFSIYIVFDITYNLETVKIYRRINAGCIQILCPW